MSQHTNSNNNDNDENKNINKNNFLFYFCARQPPPSPQWAMTPSFTRFLDHTQRRTTVGRASLGE